jgi:hypothetical protein
MGYVSDVRCIVHGKIESLIGWKSKHMGANAEIWHSMEKFRAEGEQRVEGVPIFGVIWTLRGVRWFEMKAGKEEAWLGVLQDAAETFGLSYEFIRIGEDETDVDHFHGGNFLGLLRIKKVIVAEWEKHL